MRQTKGEIFTGVLLILVLLGGIIYLVKPAAIHGESKRAAKSTETTQKVKQANEQVQANVAADVTQIHAVASGMADSPEQDFVVNESALVLTKLQAPDPQELLKSEQRKVATLSGDLRLAAKLYDKAMGDSRELRAQLDKANADKAKADLILEETAAAHLATERQKNLAFVICAGLLVLLGYTRMTRLAPGALATAVTDIRKGVDPIVAIDGVATRFEQWFVKTMAKFK